MECVQEMPQVPSQAHRARADVGGHWLIGELRSITRPSPPPKLWLAISIGIIGAGLAVLAGLIVAGHVHQAWPAHYLQDGQPGTWLTVGCLALSGIVCAAAAAGRRAEPGSAARFWAVAAATLLYLATDDAFRIHERVDLALHARFNADPLNPITDRIDDLVVLAYGLIAARYTWRHRGQILRVPWAARSLAAAFVLFVAMVACDASHVSMTLEESFKTAATLLILVGCLAVLLDPAAARQGRG